VRTEHPLRGVPDTPDPRLHPEVQEITEVPEGAAFPEVPVTEVREAVPEVREALEVPVAVPEVRA
jgi:hypothetical protein